MKLIIAVSVTHAQVLCQSGNYEILSIKISEYSIIQILLRSYWIVIICQSLARILLHYATFSTALYLVQEEYFISWTG